MMESIFMIKNYVGNRCNCVDVRVATATDGNDEDNGAADDDKAKDDDGDDNDDADV